VYVDTVVFMYAFGAESPWRDECRKFLRDASTGALSTVTSVETLQEFLHRYRVIGRGDQLEAAFSGVSACVRAVLPVTIGDVQEARTLGATLGEAAAVLARDLVHAAVARRHGVSTIVSYDRGFDLIPGVRRITPDDATRLGAWEDA